MKTNKRKSRRTGRVESLNKRKSRRSGSLNSLNKRKSRRKYGGIGNIYPFTKPSSYSYANSVDCSNMNIDSIKNMKELHTRYQKCCPKSIFGYKNSSPICKKIEQNFNNLWKIENDSHGHYGYDKTPTPTP